MNPSATPPSTPERHEAQDELPPTLEAAYVVSLMHRLRDRIQERFPSARLLHTAERLARITQNSARMAEAIRRPLPWLRLAVWILVLSIPALLLGLLFGSKVDVEVHTVSGYVALFQSSIESLVFVGLGIAFLLTLEARIKRARALRALHELRSLVHIVDMHQMDKDPAYLLEADHSTASSPQRDMTAYEVNRYLDYCSELLSVIGKLAALYSQGLHDPALITATDQLESMSNGLSRKIWQKLALLERFLPSRSQ